VAKAAALKGSVDHYDSEKVSAFSLAGDMQKRLDGLSEERDAARRGCEQREGSNDKIRARYDKLRQENDQMESRLVGATAMRRSRGDEVKAMEEENAEMENEIAYLKSQVRQAIDHAADQGAHHLDEQLDKAGGSVRVRPA